MCPPVKVREEKKKGGHLDFRRDSLDIIGIRKKLRSDE